MSQQTADIEVILSDPQAAVLEARKNLILEMSGQGGGKSQNIGYSSGMFISEFPEAIGFIGANTYQQLSHSTLVRVFQTWKDVYGFTKYDKKANPGGAYVVDTRPPAHFQTIYTPKSYDGTISFWNGALIFIGSLENYKAHEGKELAWAHLDETKDTKEAALKEVILGRLRQYGLWFDQQGDIFFDAVVRPEEAEGRGWTAWIPLYIHTSPSLSGTEWLVKMFQLSAFAKEIKKKVIQKERDFFYKEFENKAVCIYSAYHNKDNLAPGYLEGQEKNLVTEDAILKLVHGYPFGKAGGEYYPSFRRDVHVKRVPYRPEISTVSTTWDFNVVPYMTCLNCQIRTVYRYLDAAGNKHEEPFVGSLPLEVLVFSFYREYCLEEPRNSVDAIGEQFRQEHDPRFVEVNYYGDAMGLRRIEGLGSMTRFKMVEDALAAYIHNDSKKAKDPNVKPLIRRQLVDDILRGKYPEVEIEFDEDMEKTIEDFENVKLGPEGKVKSKVKDTRTGGYYEQFGHPTDAVECLVSEVCKYLIKTE
jgi:hypothetical protein